jgi:hypothetical protein
MTPAIADRLAKLLRLACCETAPDGERLAAVGRLSAIVEAQDIDWDRAFANGGGPALTEAQMSKIYAEGYSRGHADGMQEARPARDWTPAADTSSEAGDDANRLKTILEAAAESAAAGLLSEWEVEFSTSVRERFQIYGARLYVSEKMWTSLDRLETKLRRQDFMD